MNHYDGVTPDQRWRNEMLEQLKEMNRLLNRLADKQETKEERRSPGRPKQIRNAQ
ncbi:hypothetical protein [Gorillibacterium sp. CAU 1737]|uniref:hypothetical protein n=1 Tax=Gorillibacterium sp. CAU 1737 TaxID=3140362 RepID=UPI00326134F6